MILADLWKKGTNFLECSHAIMGGAMSWVSEHNLVAAISNAGGFGILACGSMPPALLREEIEKTKQHTKSSFGVNLITMHPELNALIDVCIACNVSHVVLAGGLPASHTIKMLKDHGIKLLCFAPTVAIGKKLIKQGVDALIIEGMEAGGHIGPVSTTILAQEILPILSKEVPIFVAGGIGRGEAIISFLEMGAAGCQIGTRFVCATESIAHENFKRAFIRANARDAVPSVQFSPDFPVIPVRALKNKATETFARAQQEAIERYNAGALTKEEAQLLIEKFWAGSLKRAVIDGDIEMGSVMAGQSVGMVKEIEPSAQIIASLIAQAEAQLHMRYTT